MMRERDMLPLKRYLYTSFLFALEINIFVLLLLRFCSTRLLLLIKACVKSLCLLANEGWRFVLWRRCLMRGEKEGFCASVF
jgi:hypothetical protein